MKNLIKLLVEKADANTIRNLRAYAFSTPVWDTPQNRFLKESLQIADPVQRREFLAQHLVQPKTLVQVQVHSEKVTISPDLKPNQKTIIQAGRELFVVKFVDEGKRSRVYQMREPSTGKVYALKIARDASPETLTSFAQESVRAQGYKKLGIPHAQVIEYEPHSVFKEWVEGVASRCLGQVLGSGGFTPRCARTPGAPLAAQADSRKGNLYRRSKRQKSHFPKRRMGCHRFGINTRRTQRRGGRKKLHAKAA